MARLAKCKFCGKEILDKTTAIKKSNGYYHLECYDKLQKEKEENKSDRQLLLDYINELYEGQTPKYVYIQIEEFKKNYGMKYSGMLLTLKNCFETLEIPFDNEKGIGIIPYYYDKTSNEWKRQQEINKAIEEFEFEEKEVVVNKRFSGNINKKYKEIDIGEL